MNSTNQHSELVYPNLPSDEEWLADNDDNDNTLNTDLIETSQMNLAYQRRDEGIFATF